MAAATGITSTVEDMARFVSAQFQERDAGGDRIFNTASLPRDAPRADARERLDGGDGIGFASRARATSSTSADSGSYPGYITNTLINLNGKVGVIVLANAQDGDARGIATQLMNTVGEAVAKAAGPAPDKVKWNPT